MACDRLGLTVVSLTPDVLEVRGRRLTGTLAVSDLRARCALLPRRQWQGELIGALDGLARSREAVTDLADLAVAGPLLRVRVQAEGAVLVEAVDGEDRAPVARPLCAGLVEVLVVTVQEALAPVPASAAAGWGVPEAALLDRGRRQVLETDDARVAPVDLGAGEVLAVETESAFSGVHLHRLQDLLDVPAAGALVVLPTRHLVLVAPLRTRPGALAAAQALLVNAERLWQAGPGPVSPDLFWWRPGVGGARLVHLPGTPEGLAPPQEFVDVLDALPEAQSG